MSVNNVQEEAKIIFDRIIYLNIYFDNYLNNHLNIQS